MSDMPDLLPCPFFKDAIVKIGKSQFGYFIASRSPVKDAYGEYGEYYRMPYFHDKAEAIRLWNTRAPSPAAHRENLSNFNGNLDNDKTERAGYKLVPIEATIEMIVAFAEQWFLKTRCIDDCEMEDCYKAMLSAAPSPPQAGQPIVRAGAEGE